MEKKHITQKRLYFLRMLRKLNLSQHLLLSYYRSTIQSVLTYGILAWFAERAGGGGGRDLTLAWLVSEAEFGVPGVYAVAAGVGRTCLSFRGGWKSLSPWNTIVLGGPSAGGLGRRGPAWKGPEELAGSRARAPGSCGHCLKESGEPVLRKLRD